MHVSGFYMNKKSMVMNSSHLKKINNLVIVGGGTTGWMTAAALSQHFKNQPITITLVESSQLGTVGVGEATIPTLRRFCNSLGYSDADIIKATNATCKLGIEFQDWYQIGSRFIHPFGLFGQSTKEVPFHHYWLRAKQHGHEVPLSAYSLGANLAQQNKFSPQHKPPANQLEVFDWAYHFDAHLFAELMKKHALSLGVKLLDKQVTEVTVEPDTQHISQLTFSDNTLLKGDFFIDCSGFKGLLLQQALQVPYLNWSQWLVCDRAFAVQTQSTKQPIARTIAKAHSAGWQWKIPLQNRTGNGIVYASKYCTDEQALSTLTESLTEPMLNAPKALSFTPGRCKQAWQSNCIAIGLAAGFLEPLESTSIALVETAIARIQQLLPTGQYTAQIQQQFNHTTALEYEHVRDFIILHYKLNQRTDSQMWQYCRDMPIPTTLAEKMQAFKDTGHVIPRAWEMFGKDSWLAIFDGFHYLPKQYHPRADNMPSQYLIEQLNFMQNTVAMLTEKTPSHSEFLNQFTHHAFS